MEPNSDTMQEPIGGLLAQSFSVLYKREGATVTEHISSPDPAKNRHRQPTLATLIPKDDILIFCESASKTALAKYAKPSKHATPCSQEHGVKGEPNRKQSGFRMTPRTNNSDAHKNIRKGIHQTPIDTTNGPTYHAVWRMARLES